MQLKSVKQIRNLNKKKVIVRVDYNVEIKNGKVTNTERIERSLETINFLLKNKASELHKCVVKNKLNHFKNFDLCEEISFRPRKI